jgi:thiamine kinase-like enzyme
MAEAGTAAAAGEHEVRVRLRACPATRALADGGLKRIAGGLSNQAWRLETSTGSWFVRLGHPAAARFGVDRASECAVLAAASGAGRAPEVRACEPGSGSLVTRFGPARTWAAADARIIGNVRRVARSLRQLHGLAIPDGAHEVDYAAQARRLAAHLPASDPTAAVLAGRAAAAFGRLAVGRSASALCHHDLHHLNILDDGARLWLVDWEYGGRGDPLFDVAGFLALHDLGRGPTEAFLDAYGRLPSCAPDALDRARWAFDYVQWLWYRTRFPDPAGPEAGYAERLAQKLLSCNN